MDEEITHATETPAETGGIASVSTEDLETYLLEHIGAHGSLRKLLNAEGPLLYTKVANAVPSKMRRVASDVLSWMGKKGVITLQGSGYLEVVLVERFRESIGKVLAQAEAAAPKKPPAEKIEAPTEYTTKDPHKLLALKCLLDAGDEMKMDKINKEVNLTGAKKYAFWDRMVEIGWMTKNEKAVGIFVRFTKRGRHEAQKLYEANKRYIPEGWLED